MPLPTLTTKTQRTNPPEHSLTFRSTSVFTSGVRTIHNKSKNWQCTSFGFTSRTKANGCSEHQFGRMHSASSFGLYRACGRTCTVEGKDLARYIGLRFHAASKVLVDARELAKAKRYELWQKAEFNFWCEPAGKLSEMLKDALTSQGKSFRSAVHATTSRVLSKKESWQECNECQMPASNYMHSKR